MLATPQAGWYCLAAFCILKTTAAFGFCPASKLFVCMRKGGCCALTRGALRRDRQTFFHFGTFDKISPDGSVPGRNSMIYQREIQLQTSQHGQMHDLTNEVAQIVGESKVRSGLVNIFNVGSTGAIGTIEFEPGLHQDLPAMLDKLMPPSRDYGHERAWHDGNGHSHLQATMLGPTLTVPVKNGKLVLGTWQQVFHLECDIKPRRRTIAITVMGDS